MNEEHLIGSLLFYGRSMAVDVLGYGVQADHFDDRVCRELYQAVTRLCEQESEISPEMVAMIVSPEAADKAWLLDESCIGPLGARTFAKGLIERRRKRALALGLRNAITTLDDPYEPNAINDALAHAQKAVAASAPVLHESLIDGVRRDLSVLENPTPQDSLLTTGFASWDAQIGPVRNELIVLAGRTSTGKSSLALNLMLANLRRTPGRVAALFSLEDSATSIRRRLYGIQTGYAFDYAKTFTPADRKTYAEGMAKIAAMHATLRIFDQLRDIDAIAGAIHGLADAGNLGMVIVDYLQLCNPPKDSRREQREQQVAQMSRRLQAAAHSCGAPVLALSQLNRECEKEDRKPRMTDLRESGAIEQDADRVWLIFRPSKDVNDAPQSVETPKPHIVWSQDKNKNGPKPSGWFQFDQACFRFTPIARNHGSTGS